MVIVGCSVENTQVNHKQPLAKGDYWVLNNNSNTSQVYRNGKIYGCTIELGFGSRNYTYSFDFETGKVDWITEVGSWATYSPIVLDSSIYYCSYLGHVYLLNDTGGIKWEKRIRGSYSGHRVNSINNNLFVSSVERGVFEFDHITGDVINVVGNAVGEMQLGVTLPVISESMICYANLGDGDTQITGNQMMCFDYYSKDTLWKREFSHEIDELYSDSDRIYFESGQLLYCVGFNSGKTIWSASIPWQTRYKFVFRDSQIIAWTGHERQMKVFNKVSGEAESKIFEMKLMETDILVGDSIYNVKCQLGSFSNNDKFDNSCEIVIKQK